MREDRCSCEETKSFSHKSIPPFRPLPETHHRLLSLWLNDACVRYAWDHFAPTTASRHFIYLCIA